VLTFAVLILGGKLGDRFGRKRMFLVGLVIVTLASAACAQATNDMQLIAFRIQGEQPSSTHSRSRSSSPLSPATS
jgi:MFS family permease